MGDCNESKQGPVQIALLGTCDTKLHELLALREEISICGGSEVRVVLIDVGRECVEDRRIRWSQEEVLMHGDREDVDLMNMPRGEVIEHMITCGTKLIEMLYENSKKREHPYIDAVVSAGGSGGTSLSAAIMRDALPIGFPKLLVSTVASGDTGPYVGESDITMMYSVVDIAGSNEILRLVFRNAAAAITGMATTRRARLTSARPQTHRRRRIAATMFGVTTPCVDRCRSLLEEEHDCEVTVFHATGHGGKGMERLAKDGAFDGILDITTTEVADQLFGGNMSAGAERLDAMSSCGIPYVLSVGACDMVNFGAKSTVPEKYQGRKLFEHNLTVTLLRTNKGECHKIGEFIANKLKQAKDLDKIAVVLPTAGFSMLSGPGGPFANEEADTALCESLEHALENTKVKIEKVNENINEPRFAKLLVSRLMQMFT